MKNMQSNRDDRVVAGFGDEWVRFPQDKLDLSERDRIFNGYFGIFPWEALTETAVGADIGCGSGRWAAMVAPRVAHLHLVDASELALDVARKNLASQGNVSFHHASVEALPFNDGSLDFAFSLGVLHHVSDTAGAVAAVARKLKPAAPLLIYLYYAFEGRPLWFRMLWRVSDVLRRGVSRLPYALRYAVSQGIALVIYWPLARMARILERRGELPRSWPLAYYRDKSLYVMRTDALDRFGTVLERRFTRPQIAKMLESAGFSEIQFSDQAPYWCVVAVKASL
jgi:SAM-dependent methyltransferase